MAIKRNNAKTVKRIYSKQKDHLFSIQAIVAEMDCAEGDRRALYTRVHRTFSGDRPRISLTEVQEVKEIVYNGFNDFIQKIEVIQKEMEVVNE